jgi:hypothetical protein
MGAPLPGQQRVWRNKPPLKAAPRPSDANSDSERTATPPPPKGGVKLSNLLNDDSSAKATPVKGSGRGNWRRKDVDSPGNYKSSMRDSEGVLGTSVFTAYNADTPTMSSSGKRVRAPTSTQRTAESNRKAQVNAILSEGLGRVRRTSDRKRARNSMATRMLVRVRDISPEYDSEDEAQKTGHGRIGAARVGVSMGGFKQAESEINEYGAEAWTMAKTLAKLRRRLRWKWESEGVALGNGPARKRMKRSHREEDDLMEVDGIEYENGSYDADESRLQLRAGADDEWSEGDD